MHCRCAEEFGTHEKSMVMMSMTPWESIQERIWKCEACNGNRRVQLNIRQQTPYPVLPVDLLFIGIAPPSCGEPIIRTIAKSATNDPKDNLRQFIEESITMTW